MPNTIALIYTAHHRQIKFAVAINRDKWHMCNRYASVHQLDYALYTIRDDTVC